MKMKKIICAVIALCCLLTLFACNLKPGENNNNSGPATVETFQNAITATDPKFVSITTKVTSALGDLNSSYSITFSEDGSASIEYSYEKFNSLEDGAANELKAPPITGTVNRAADGTVTGDVASAPDLSAVTAGTAIALSSLPAESVTISESGDTLTATVTGDASEGVFGVAFPEDVTLVITINGGKVDGVRITGETMSINCSYGY